MKDFINRLQMHRKEDTTVVISDNLLFLVLIIMVAYDLFATIWSLWTTGAAPITFFHIVTWSVSLLAFVFTYVSESRSSGGKKELGDWWNYSLLPALFAAAFGFIFLILLVGLGLLPGTVDGASHELISDRDAYLFGLLYLFPVVALCTKWKYIKEWMSRLM
jgi:hypothetical protein